MSTFWKKFYQRPLEEIPWQRTQADWFLSLASEGKLSGHTSLDLGCGTGTKSVFLATKMRFERCVGIDVAPRAIAFAKQNALQHHVADVCEFICGDVTNLSLLGGETFDVIIDWAALHCIRPEHRAAYAEQISQHSNTGSLLLLRAFAHEDSREQSFDEHIDAETETIFFSSEKELDDLFPHFHVLATNKSKPATKPEGFYFLERLLKKV